MHELSLVADLFEILEENASKEKASKITAVQLRIGLISGVVPELLQTAFDTYKKETLASEAELRIEVSPLKIRCRACSRESATNEPVFACSDCGSGDIEIIEGQEMVLEKMEVEI